MAPQPPLFCGGQADQSPPAAAAAAASASISARPLATDESALFPPVSLGVMGACLSKLSPLCGISTRIKECRRGFNPQTARVTSCQRLIGRRLRGPATTALSPIAMFAILHGDDDDDAGLKKQTEIKQTGTHLHTARTKDAHTS